MEWQTLESRTFRSVPCLHAASHATSRGRGQRAPLRSYTTRSLGVGRFTGNRSERLGTGLVRLSRHMWSRNAADNCYHNRDITVERGRGRQADFDYEQPGKSADGSPRCFAEMESAECRAHQGYSKAGGAERDWSKYKSHGPGCKTVISLERNGCGLRPDHGIGKSWGCNGEQGPQAWVRLIGTVLCCKARRIQRRHERQGWHQGNPSTHALPRNGTRSSFTPNWVTRPMGQQSGVVCDD